ncbi:MAG: membrane dipeptidase [Bacteroidia bacterium]|nr:membrane dipeptidase [Bacteroidia bacterium]
MYPVIDFHCDMLSYMLEAPNPQPNQLTSIGCSIPALLQGNVVLQIMAIYSTVEPGSSVKGIKQSVLFNELISSHSTKLQKFDNTFFESRLGERNTVTCLAAIENAASFAEENEPLSVSFKRLEKIITTTGKLAYIGLTHHGENRFGGGNSTSVGLKKDGEALLEYLSEKKIGLDFSHTSDALAYDILTYISKNKLQVPILASHSNFRSVYKHPRNLPDEIAHEIILQKGLIGMNFLRAFVNDKNPDALLDHIEYGMKLGAEDALCFGADFFYIESHPDQSRVPFFYPQHQNAATYPTILNSLTNKYSIEQLKKLSQQNAINLTSRLC